MTTATMLGRLNRTVDRIDAEARQLDPAKVALTLIALVPFLLFWLAGVAARAVWLVAAWLWTAGVVGWRSAWPPRPDGE